MGLCHHCNFYSLFLTLEIAPQCESKIRSGSSDEAFAVPPVTLFYRIFASKHKASRELDYSDNTSFRLVKSSTTFSLRFFLVPCSLRKNLSIQAIMRYRTRYSYSNPSLQLYTTSDQWQPKIFYFTNTMRRSMTLVLVGPVISRSSRC